jgi:hypothetical protein
MTKKLRKDDYSKQSEPKRRQHFEGALEAWAQTREEGTSAFWTLEFGQNACALSSDEAARIMTEYFTPEQKAAFNAQLKAECGVRGIKMTAELKLPPLGKPTDQWTADEAHSMHTVCRALTEALGIDEHERFSLKELVLEALDQDVALPPPVWKALASIRKSLN